MNRELAFLSFLISLLPIALLGQTTPHKTTLVTPWGEKLNKNSVWQEYPRPQLQRESWQNLNGKWDFYLGKKGEAKPSKLSRKILVPFAVESKLSGIQETVLPEHRLWYKKTFSLDNALRGKDIILHFEAVDFEATVWVNDILLGSHKGGYDRFSFNITPYLKEGKNAITVVVDDPSNFGPQARGKQQLPSQGIWYTPVSGIWQTVWLEGVSKETWLEELKITPDIDKGTVSILPMPNTPSKEKYMAKIKVISGGATLNETETGVAEMAKIKIDNAKLWSPDTPHLYDLLVTLVDEKGNTVDEVKSYFGMRKISLGDHKGGKYLFLNNEPLFQYGTLDQGWWPDGLHTPPSDEAMLWDIEMTKKMGFNTIRKHIKIEPDRWYYHCDRLGMLVWQDMPSGMVVVPNPELEKRPLHLQHAKRGGPDLHLTAETKMQYELELQQMIYEHYNHPSIVMWVPFNEGWGQYNTCRVGEMVKALDGTRLVNAVSGWSLRPCGEVYDIHTYQTEVRIPSISRDMASVIGEYGGIGYPVEGHLWKPGFRNWGYQTYQSESELLENYKSKFDQIVKMKNENGLSAAIYTQTTDVEGEVNGLITYDRKVVKIPVETLSEIHKKLKEEEGRKP
ncbi:MAG: sugar-binding domain-containing protein [Bacteroidota bacterium]